LGRTEMVITKMVTIKIMEVRKEGIWSVSISKHKG
jgi:hypothetical protein